MITDWIGGMFMLFSSKDFKKLKGFDEEFFLYFEDVNICYRANKLGMITGQANLIKITHIGQRKSSKNYKVAEKF